MRRRFALIGALVIAACAHAPASEPEAPRPSSRPAAKPAATPNAPERDPERSLLASRLVGGVLVDVPGRRIVRELTTDHLYESALFGETVYARVGDRDTPQELRAYERADGRHRWTVRLTHKPVLENGGVGHDCQYLTAAPGGAFCIVAANFSASPSTPAGVAFFSASDGAQRHVLASERIARLSRVGSNVVAMQSGGTSCANGTIAASADDGRASVGVSGACVESAVLKALDGRTGAEIPIGSDSAALGFLGFQPAFVSDSHRSESAKTVVCAASTVSRTAASGRESRDTLDAICFDESRHPTKRVHEVLTGAQLAVREHTSRFVVVETKLPDVRSLVVDMERGEITKHAPGIAAVVRTETGLDALLSPPDLIEPTGARRWAMPPNLGPELHAVRAGDKVVITSYDRNAPGATLVALDAKTGATAWSGDVELRVTGKRARYSTTVRLAVDGDAVVLEGSESSQEYLQIFSLADGKRLLSVVRGR